MKAFVEFVTHDWYFAIPMFGMSIAGIMLVIWRIMLNTKAAADLNELLPAVQKRLEKEGIEATTNYCKSREDLIARKLYGSALEVAKQGNAAARRAMTHALELDILPDLNALLPSILAIAKIATMVGLLGTVISMIGTFQAIQSSTGGGVGSQAGAIGLALFATAMGLVTAIPLVFSHVLFKAWIHKYEVKCKSAAMKLLLILQSGKIAKDPPAKEKKDGKDAKDLDVKDKEKATAGRR